MLSLFENSIFIVFIVACTLVSQGKAAEPNEPNELIASLGSHRFLQNCQIKQLGFTADSRRIIAVGEDRTIVWDVASGDRVRVFNVANVIAGAISKNGERVVISTNDPGLAVYEVESGKVTWESRPEKRRFQIAISEDGDKIAVSETGRIAIYDPNGKLLTEIESESDEQTLCFSPDGNRLVCGTRKGRNVVYSLDRDEALVLEGGDGTGVHFDFAEDGEKIVGSSQITKGSTTTECLRIWDPTTGKVVMTKTGVGKNVRFSPNGRLLVAANGYTANVVDASTGNLLKSIGKNAPRIGPVAFSPNGKILATTQNFRIRLWNTKTWEEIEPGSGHDARTHLVEFSKDGKTVVTAGRDSSVIVWSWPDGKPRAQIRGLGQDSYGVRSLSISPDSKRVLFSSRYSVKRDSFSLYDLSNGKKLSDFGPGALSPCIFLPNGNQAVSPDKDGGIAIWDVATGEKLRTVGALKDNRITDLCPTGNGNSVWWAGEFQQFGIRDLKTGEDSKPLSGFSHHGDASITLSPKGDCIAISGRVADLESNEFLLKDQHLVTAISPDGQLLAVGRSIYEKSTRQIIHTFAGKQSPDYIEAATFSPDGSVLLTTGDPDTSVWDMTGLLSKKSRVMPKLDLAKDELEDLWKSLSGEDGWKAQRAAWKLAAGGKKAADFLSGKVQVATAPSPETLTKLRGKLRGNDLDGRQLAARELIDLGIKLEPDELALLRRVDPTILPANASSVEDAILKGYDPKLFLKPAPILLPLPKRVRETRAIAALFRCSDPSARTVLEALADGHAESPLTKEAAALLKLKGK